MQIHYKKGKVHDMENEKNKDDKLEKTKVINGVTYILDEETETYLPEGDFPPTEDEILEQIKNDKWKKMRFEFLRGIENGVLFKLYINLDIMTEELKITEETAGRVWRQNYDSYMEKNIKKINKSDSLQVLRLMNEAESVADEIVIKEVIENPNAYVPF